MRKYTINGFIAILICLGAISTSKAQYFRIPDTNFAAYLDTTVPSAMVGNQLDTTNPVVKALRIIRVENKAIKSLTGIQYFTGLTTLDCGNGDTTTISNSLTGLGFTVLPVNLDTLICGNNQISSLPALPITLQYLACYNNRLDSLPVLPDSLRHLDCDYNQLQNLPALPNKLSFLNCMSNNLANLPVLPSSLQYLECSGNNLATLPALPDSLQTLYCDEDGLSNLPNLPLFLQSLSCYGNQITSLPVLPDTLDYLDCGSNQLTNLPALPPLLNNLDCDNNLLTVLTSLPNSLGALSCFNNQLTSLPALPSALGFLQCFSNQLTTLPALPNNLQYLNCQNNNISCFPRFPNSLIDSNYFDISNNPFTCLPSYVPGMNNATLAFPLCSAGNSRGCPIATGIIGFTFRDNNSNCIKDSPDIGLSNVPIQLFSNTMAPLALTYSALNGVYDFPDSATSYTVGIDTTGMDFMIQCAHPGLDSAFTVPASLLDTNINFSIKCKPGFDVGFQSIVITNMLFPGFQSSWNIVAGDMTQQYKLNCASGISGQVQISLSGPVTFVGPASGALTPAVAGQVLTYAIADFGAINNRTAFNLILLTDTTAQQGDSICISISVSPTTGDINPGNNTFQACYPVKVSHDPNFKETIPVNVAPGFQDWFTYTVHFQNTGTAAAQNIRVIDSLDSRLDLKTFRMSNYSNQCTVMLIHNRLSVSFPNIQLPDSNVSSQGSKGFFQYRIKPLANLNSGTVIDNTAFIYFDYNAPVVTNTSKNYFLSIPSGINPVKKNSPDLSIYPNPADKNFNVQSNSTERQTLQIFDVTGKLVLTQILNSSKATIDSQNLAQGVYNVCVSGSERRIHKRLVIVR